jgi:hypothetical protein
MKITHRQIIQIIKEEVGRTLSEAGQEPDSETMAQLAQSIAASERGVQHHDNSDPHKGPMSGALKGFHPELGLEGSGPEIEAHLRNIQASQTGNDREGEQAAILTYLEWLSDMHYDEARQSGAPESGDQAMFDIAVQLDEYVHQALADSSYDPYKWIENISQHAAEQNPDIGGLLTDEEDELRWYKS